MGFDMGHMERHKLAEPCLMFSCEFLVPLHFAPISAPNQHIRCNGLGRFLFIWYEVFDAKFGVKSYKKNKFQSHLHNQSLVVISSPNNLNQDIWS
jgi:hypothetical protein